MVDKLQVVALSKAYRVDGSLMPVLDGVDLGAAEGSFVSIIGPSGCGKSTLFSIISGLQRPDRGHVILGGTASDGRLGQVGYMPQRDLLLPWRRVLDNAILGPEVHGEDVAAARREAQQLLPLFGLEGFGESYPAALSGGMRQRAALLRTLLCRRDILLLDEPFGALDAITRMDLQEWLLRIWQEFRYTILFITHDVEEAIFLADHVFVLSSRPARVRLELPVELPRPRSRSATLTPAFALLKQRVLEALVDATPVKST
jgi:ABC-type nitrate/sulfonate/bicarbonate transport system ATPase subunit